MQLAGFVIVAVALVVAAALLARRGPDPAAVRAMDGLTHGLARLQSDLTRLAKTQDDLRQDVHHGREASLLQLSDVAQGLRGEIGQAHRALAEVKALEQGRARQMEQASDSLRRLEAVVAGSSTRGAAGENILARALGQLPPDLLEINVSFGNKIVEYALRLPGGRFLPIDSKWTSVGILERLDATEDPLERKRLVEQIVRDVRGRIRDMGKYLDPERTLSLGLLAVPDAVYEAAPEAHGEGYRAGVLVVPYSLALPYVLALYRLTLRFGCAVDTDQLADRIRGLEETLRRVDEEVEGRLSRGLVQAGNARDALRDHVVEARRAAQKLLLTAESEAPVPLAAIVAGPVAVPHLPQLLRAARADVD
ncbi:MAG TPA: DNA recombination protein RmuC [Vicinamibacteria bacterium]|nr:DNA recombination protein RmuC [Vicinamibacteria bacterium]